MTEEEFLARWSLRKRASKPSAPPAEAAKPARETPASSPAVTAEPEVDFGSLPTIDSITAGTDITAFLRKGVPQDLMRGALRRAWSADPAIRDFIGLAENAWDFNDPNAMPGFGPLDCSQAELAAWVERIVGGLRNTAEARTDMPPQLQESPDVPNTDVVHCAVRTEPDQAVHTEIAARVAPQPDTEANTGRRRTHGGALPR